MRELTRWTATGLCLLTLLAPLGCRGGARAKARAARAAAKASAVTPTADAAAAVGRAQRLRQQGDRQGALRELERAIAANPRFVPAYMVVGDIHRDAGEYGQAERAYEQAATIEPRNFDAQYFHGLALQLLDRIADAIRAYLRALTVRPDDFNANLNLATAYLQMNEPAQGLPYAKRAVSLRAGSAAARINLAALYAALEQHEDAIIEYRQAAELMELTPELLLNLAESLGKAGRLAEMQSTLESLIASHPSAAAYERLGSCLFRLQKYPEALSYFRKSLELDANYYPAHNGVGVCRLNDYLWSEKSDLEARDEAMRSLRRSLQIERRQPRVIELVSRYG